jgi:predicted DCC family thiol-disulfide oxidoreductase YuxK
MSGRIILFDGVCNLCNASVKFIIKRDPKAYFRFATLQSDFARGILRHNNISSENLESLVLVENDIVFLKSTAALKIARELNGLWPLFYSLMIIPKSIRDFFYDLIARHRYRLFGRKSICMVPDQEFMKRFFE